MVKVNQGLGDVPVEQQADRIDTQDNGQRMQEASSLM